MTNARGGQHLVFDAEVVDGLTYAYKARKALRAARTRPSRKLRNAISRTARGSFWRYPTIRLNQVNWYALMYAADHTVTGDATLLKRDLRAQLLRFVARRARPNFGPGHALPLPAARAPQPPDERGLGRVREHRPELHALLRPGAHAPGWRRCRPSTSG